MKPFLALLFVSASACVTSTAQHQAAENVIARVEALRLEQGIPGLAVAIVDGTEIVAARGFGLADVAKGIAVTSETPFNIASVAKPLSAVVALKLVAEGTLDLDRPMMSFASFPEFCTAASEAGGIFFSDYQCTDERLTLRRVLSMTANGEPGTRFWYNPPSFSWASRPIAEGGGKPFSQLVDQLVFRPAGMIRSARIHRALPLRDDLAADLATPHHLDDRGRPVVSDPPPPQGDGAAGGVISTVIDLARFDIALSEGRLLSPQSLREMWQAARTPSGERLPYGLGWFLGQYRGHSVAWHTGLWEGRYSALYLTLFRENGRRTTLILLANSDGLQWPAEFDEAAIERSPFALAFLDQYIRSSL
jgi:CubicO group peptidase (beta-lactamase class C family)